jgi:polyhydroxybutyrate depolymerase
MKACIVLRYICGGGLLLAACATRGAGTPESSAEGSAAVGTGEARANACERAQAPAAGLSEHTLESGGLGRRFLLRLPAASAGEKLPVVLNLHGTGGTPEDQLALSGLEQLLGARRFALVAPAGYERVWNVPPEANKPDDVRFIADVLDAVAELACVDRARVYATGFSGGGRMSSQLACDLSTRIAAVAAIGGVRFPGPCAQARPFPVLAFHGTADDVNPYAGGGRPYWQTSVEAAIDGWATHNRCAARTEEPTATSVQRIAYGAGCTEVVLYRIAGLGHVWPSEPLVTAPPAPSEAVSAGETTANEILWAFFARHPLP